MLIWFKQFQFKRLVSIIVNASQNIILYNLLEVICMEYSKDALEVLNLMQRKDFKNISKND